MAVLFATTRVDLPFRVIGGSGATLGRRVREGRESSVRAHRLRGDGDDDDPQGK